MTGSLIKCLGFFSNILANLSTNVLVVESMMPWTLEKDKPRVKHFFPTCELHVLSKSSESLSFLSIK
jgi:hypothetical protein